MENNQSFYKRTKIITTVGSALTNKLLTLKSLKDPKNTKLVKDAYTKIEQAIVNGVNCFRMNFSHGEYEEHLTKMKIIRDVASKLNKNVALMLDTKGPEIRCGKFKQVSCLIKAGTKVIIHTIKKIIGTAKEFSVSDSSENYNMANDVKINSRILVDDGKLELVVKKVDADKGIIECVATNSHAICEKKRINLPGCNYALDFLSQKDIDDISFGCKNNVDYIAASFVNSAQDVKQIREVLIQNHKPNIQIISKIESSNAIKNLDEIIEASDGIMVARGDLALEIPYYDVPYWQKQIIRKCRYNGKPCIVATQMLDSMEQNVQPTRAEVTDVFFAVERGADATMLSGESAKGLFPILAIQTMAKIDITSELLFDYDRAIKFYFPKTNFPKYTRKQAIKIAKKLQPKNEDLDGTFSYNFVVVFSDDKLLIRTISNIRPAGTIIVVTSEEDILRSFSISYGIQTYLIKDLAKAKKDYLNVSHQAIDSFNHQNKKGIAYFDKKFHKLD